MVIADSESPGPIKKRPRLSLKFMKQGANKDGGVKNNDSEKHTEETTDTKNSCDDVKTVQELAMTAGGDGMVSSEDESVVPAVASLENLGNTCFLNSILQVLRYTPRFLDGLEDLYLEIINVEKLKKQEAVDIEDADSSDYNDCLQTLDVVKFLYKLYKEMERREEKHPDVASSDVTSMALKPEKLLNSLREINPMFEGNLQHDAQELMRCVLCYLQDAEKEIYKMKSSLPPRVLPQKGPTNPIMQKFIAVSKVTKSKNSDTELQDVKPDKFANASKTELQNSDFLDVIERSETAKTGNYKDPKETNEGFIDKSSTTIKDDAISEKLKLKCEPCATSLPQQSVNQETCGNGGKRSRLGRRKSDSKSRSTSKAEPNKEAEGDLENKAASDAKGKEKPTRNKRGRKNNSDETDSVKRKRYNSDSQPNLLSMLKCQVSRKRLGMRGAIVKDNTNNNNTGLSKDDTDKEKSDKEGQTFSGKNNRANLLTAYGITGEKIEQKMTKMESESPEKCCVDYSKINGDSPSKWSGNNIEKGIHPFIKLEKCDRVCSSPQKSVNADYAERTLSPMKTNAGSITPKKLDSARKLTFNKDNHDCTSEVHENQSTRVLNKFVSCTSPARMKQLSPSKLLKCSPKKNKKDFVEKLFMGSMMLRTRCLECENSKERLEDFHDISVPLRKEKNQGVPLGKEKNQGVDEDDVSDSDDEGEFGLKKLMDTFTEVERLQDDNKYFCENCLHKVEAERSLHYEVLPDILTLHLKRFQASSGLFGYVSKINDHINIPILLPCLRYKCPSPCSRPDHKYRLYAVVTHAGVTLTAGHYLAYVKVIDASKLRNSAFLSSISHATSRLESDKMSKTSTNRSLSTGKKTAKQYDTKFGWKSGNTAFLNVPLQKYESDWLECDDEAIRVYNEEKFCGLLTGEGGAVLGTPYVLFYHRLSM